MRLKTKLFAVKFRHILEVFSVQALEKVMGAFARCLRPRMKLFVIEFKGILEVFAF